MSGTAYKCPNCGGAGMLLIEINPDGEKQSGNSYIEKPCDVCGGERLLTKAQLISAPADKTLAPEDFLPIPLAGAFRAYADGQIIQRKMSSRQLFKLAQYTLNAAIETQNFERARDAGSTDD